MSPPSTRQQAEPASSGRPGGLWAADRRALTTGLVLTVTFVASEALAVVTIMPVVARELGGLRLYGWVFSAFMLGSVFGIVAAGRLADRRGPAIPYVGGLVLFGAGLAIAGLAPAMLILVIGRALQGIGAGAIPAVAYAAIGRTLPDRLRARMMAVLSTAWVVPGLVGPAVSAAVASLVGWRWVFLGLLPLVAVTGSFAVPTLLRLGAPGVGAAERPAGGQPGGEHRLSDGLGAAAGAGLVLAGLTEAGGSRNIPLGAPLVLAGCALSWLVLRRLLPPGAFRLRRGLPATVLSRGMLTFAFFGADAYVPLTITTVRHHSTALASLAVTGSTLAWTAGAWVQARLSVKWPGRRLIRLGLAIILAGLGGMFLALRPGVPIAEAIASWTVAGLGMGLGYAPITLLMMREAPPGREGWASASLNLCDVLGTALGVGIGGAAVAAGTAAGWPLSAGVSVAFAIAVAMAVLALIASVRLPAGLPAPDRTVS